MSKPKTGTLLWIPTPSPGHWRARITLPDGTRPVVHFPSGLSEERAKDMAMAMSERGALCSSKTGPKGKTVGDLLDPWLALVRKSGVSPGTIKKDEGAARRFGKVFGALRPEEMTTSVLRKWVRDLKDEGLGAARITALYSALGKMFDCARGEEWIMLPENPCRHPGMKGVLPSAEDKPVVTLTRAQTSALLHVSDRRLRYGIALTSGLRDGEIAALRGSSLRYEQDILVYDIQEHLAIDGPKGRSTLGPLKTPSSKRLVPVHSSLVGYFSERMDYGFFFTFAAGKPYRPESAHILQQDLHDKGVTFHALRRTFSTRLASAGVPEELRDRLLGHSPRSVGLRHYTNTDLRRLQQAVECIVIDSAHAEELPSRTYAEPNGNLDILEKIKVMSEGGYSDDPKPNSPGPKDLDPSSKSADVGGYAESCRLKEAILKAVEAGEWDIAKKLMGE